MGLNFTLAELRSRLDRLDTGAVLKLPEYDYERFFGINEGAAAKAAQFARMHHCVCVPGVDAVYFRKWSADASTGPTQDDDIHPNDPKSVQPTFGPE